MFGKSSNIELIQEVCECICQESHTLNPVHVAFNAIHPFQCEHVVDNPAAVGGVSHNHTAVESLSRYIFFKGH